MQGFLNTFPRIYFEVKAEFDMLANLAVKLKFQT